MKYEKPRARDLSGFSSATGASCSSGIAPGSCDPWGLQAGQCINEGLTAGTCNPGGTVSNMDCAYGDSAIECSTGLAATP